MLLGDREDGAWTVVSQYGGTASAWAVAYEGGASFWASSGITFLIVSTQAGSFFSTLY